MNMHTQLAEIAERFDSATRRLYALRDTIPENRWSVRPTPGAWSAAECVAHLNLTSAAFLPILQDGLARARRLGTTAPPRHRRDLLGWLLWRTMPPPVKLLRARTAAPFVPGGQDPPGALIAEFDRLQSAQLAAVRDADGLPLDRIKVVSAFDRRVKYNLFSCLSVLPEHQHRHLWQAEQVHRGANLQMR